MRLEHLVKQPTGPTEENPPLLIMLHGYGSDENDLFSFADELPENLLVLSAKAPYPMQPFGNAWYAIHWDREAGKNIDVKQAVESRERIGKFIDEAVEAYGADPDNVTLLGFSQGAILSYAVALSYPEKVKNIIALSGYLDERMLADNYRDKDWGRLDFYCSHGTADQVIPVAAGRMTDEFLTRLGISHQYSEFPVGHGVAPDNFYESKAWLEGKV